MLCFSIFIVDITSTALEVDEITKHLKNIEIANKSDMK
jgi:hypothetical protein